MLGLFFGIPCEDQGMGVVQGAGHPKIIYFCYKLVMNRVKSFTDCYRYEENYDDTCSVF